jgi:aminoglycoside phosphotransferase (APT) family kinase protein
MDYHPQNVIVHGLRVTGVIDWVSADRGDRHLCAATTSVILASSAMDHPRWMRDNATGNSLRALFTALYIPSPRFTFRSITRSHQWNGSAFTIVRR